MSDDWLKMRTNLQTHPKVVRMASALDADTCPHGVRGCLVVGALHAVWSLFDTHSEDGALIGYTPDSLDYLIRVPGFSSAMIDVGWLVFDNDKTLTLPEFSEHNGASAKRRALEAKRKRDARRADACPQSVRTTSGQVSASNADAMRTRERERERSNTPCSPPPENSSDDEKPKSKSRPRRPKVGIERFIADCRSRGEDFIPDGEPVFDYAEHQANIPAEFLHLAFEEFVERYRNRDKRYTDWRAVFRNAIRENWMELWWHDGNGFLLTSRGKQAMQAYRSRHEQEAA